MSSELISCGPSSPKRDGKKVYNFAWQRAFTMVFMGHFKFSNNMHTVDHPEHGYVMAAPPQIQGTPAGDYFNTLMRGLTHKQNNYLAVIQGFSSLILMSDGLESGIKENLDHMKEAAQGAAALAERILATAGCMRVNPQPLQLRDYLPLMEGSLQAAAQKVGVPLQVNLNPATPPVMVDSGKLKDALSEIILNGAEGVVSAGKAQNGGAVALDILPPGLVPEGRPGCVDIFVRNNGAMIPPEKLRDIFKPFMSTRDSKHLGIGLSTAAVLLSQMGGTLGVKSDLEMTTFWISIPAVTQ